MCWCLLLNFHLFLLVRWRFILVRWYLIMNFHSVFKRKHSFYSLNCTHYICHLSWTWTFVIIFGWFMSDFCGCFLVHSYLKTKNPSVSNALIFRDKISDSSFQVHVLIIWAAMNLPSLFLVCWCLKMTFFLYFGALNIQRWNVLLLPTVVMFIEINVPHVSKCVDVYRDQLFYCFMMCWC
jgi:hypothetical protein